MISRGRGRTALPALLALGLLAGCSGGGSDERGTPSAQVVDPTAAASAPVPGVTLPPDALLALVPTPAEVPAGMVPVLSGSGPRPLDVVAGYSGTGPAKQAAVAQLTAHGFRSAYVAQYASPTSGQVVSVVVSQFATAAGATADFADDQRGATGSTVPTATLGEASSVRLQELAGSPPSQLVLVRFRRGTTTWSLAYKATPKAEPQVAIDLAKALLGRSA